MNWSAGTAGRRIKLSLRRMGRRGVFDWTIAMTANPLQPKTTNFAMAAEWPATTGNVCLTPMLADSSITRRSGVLRPGIC
jgi:hypothetical protein